MAAVLAAAAETEKLLGIGRVSGTHVGSESEQKLLGIHISQPSPCSSPVKGTVDVGGAGQTTSATLTACYATEGAIGRAAVNPSPLHCATGLNPAGSSTGYICISAAFGNNTP